MTAELVPHVTTERLRRQLDDLAPETSGREVELVFRAIVAASQALFASDGAGVMLVDDGNVLHYAAATDERAARLEAAQAETGTGPCVDSLVLDETIATSDILADARWPELRPGLARIGVRAVLGTPVRLGGLTVGSLNVYRAQVYEWDDSDTESIVALARLTGEVLGLAMVAAERSRLADQLSHALEHRVTVERAVGVLMERDRVGPVEAFNRLRSHARSHRIRVADVARRIVEGRDLTEAHVD